MSIVTGLDTNFSDISARRAFEREVISPMLLPSKQKARTCFAVYVGADGRSDAISPHESPSRAVFSAVIF